MAHPLQEAQSTILKQVYNYNNDLETEAAPQKQETLASVLSDVFGYAHLVTGKAQAIASDIAGPGPSCDTAREAKSVPSLIEQLKQLRFVLSVADAELSRAHAALGTGK